MMKIIITEEQKKNLFIPRNLEKRKVEFEKMVKIGSDKFLKDNDIKTLNYSIKTQNRLSELNYYDIDDATFNSGEIILNNNEKIDSRKRFYHISHSDFIDYSHIMSGYLNYLIINNHSPKESKIIGLDINIESVVGNIKIDGIIVSTIFDRDTSKVNFLRDKFTKTL